MRRNERLALRLRGGFTMVEVVAALAIAGGVIVGVLFARARAAQNCASARMTMTSARIGASLAARLRAGEIGEGAGAIEEGGEFHWRIVGEVRPSGAPESLRAYAIEVLPPSGEPLDGCALRVWRHEFDRPEGEGASP